MATNKRSFVLYCDLLHAIHELNREERGDLLTAILEYVNDKDPVPESRVVKVAFDHVKVQLKRDLIKYESIREKRRAAAKQSVIRRAKGDSDQSEHLSTSAHTREQVLNDVNKTDKCSDDEQNERALDAQTARNVKGNVNEQSPKANKRFIPPTVEVVQEYCKERNNRVDASKFVDYYTANGWKVGKNPMKDWKAAVRMWEKSGYDKSEPPKKNVKYLN